MGSDTFTYDANGNQATRNVGGNSYTLSYDAENRLVSVSGAATASFVYDGDGNRVKGTIGTNTITYVGNYLEWKTSTSDMIKYYYAGSTRVAMRTGSSTLNYLLGDHLGSQSITTDSNGLNPAEIRYYPWGTERYTSGTTPTAYHFTGQRLESTIGLYFYGARWYDPGAGRFIQADSVVPIPNSNQEDIKQIQLSLIVDYHETYLLSQLNKMYRDELAKSAKFSEEQSGKKQQLSLKSDTKAPLQGEFNEAENKSLENLRPINFNNMSDIGKSSQRGQQEDKSQESRKQDQINIVPYKLNSMSLDRFAYVSNCPTSYTDPSGHCTPLIEGIGTAIMVFGGAMFTAGVWGIKSSLAAIPENPELAISLAAASSVAAIGGGLIGYAGEQILETNDCLPKVQ